MPIEERVRKVIREQLSMSFDIDLPGGTLLDDIGVDPLDLFDVLVALEGEFNCELPDETNELKTVQDLIDQVLLKILTK